MISFVLYPTHASTLQMPPLRWLVVLQVVYFFQAAGEFGFKVVRYFAFR